jgi:hypothetical protein
LKYGIETENAIMEVQFLRCIINDILSTEEYTQIRQVIPQ